MKDDTKYFKAITYIKSKIESGVYKAGDKISSEAVLAVELAISRMTVRKAVLHLVGENVLYQKAKQGTFVKSDSDKLVISIGHKFGFERSTRLVKSEVVLLEKIKVPYFLQKKVGWADTLEVYHYKRRRFLDSVVYAFEEGYIPCNVLEVSNHILETSVLNALSERGYSPVKMEREFEALIPSIEIRNYFKISSNVALLKVNFTRYNNNEIFCYNETYYNGGECKFVEITP